MQVFLTGATGFVGTALTKDLIANGHKVLGMARSEAGAAGLRAAGGDVLAGSLADLESLRVGASTADGVIHCAFNHDFSKFAAHCEEDRVAIETLGKALEGSGRPLIVTSGLATRALGRPATEDDDPLPVSPEYPRASESAAEQFASRGVLVGSVRLPQVHDTQKHGLVTWMIAIAREKGVSAYVGDGSSRFAAVHILDAARVYRLGLEHIANEKPSRPVRFHAVAEEGVPLRDIAETIGRGLNIPVVSQSPEEAVPHFGFLARFAARGLTGSSAQTQQWLNWSPSGPNLLTDLAAHFT